MSSEWIKYTCKSGQTLFIYNKVTGEHRWAANHNNESIQDDITHGQPMRYKELCDVSTQTDNYGCPNGCSSMYIDTNLEILANSVVEVSMNGLDDNKSGGNVVDVRSVQVANGFSSTSINCSTIFESNSQPLNKRKRLINTNVANGKHTNAIERHSVSDVLAANTMSPPKCTESLTSKSQETQVNKVLLSTNVTNSNDGPIVITCTSVPVTSNVSSNQTLNGNSPQSHANSVEGNTQEINVNQRKHLLDTNIITNSSNHDDMNMPIISSVSSIQSSNRILPSSCANSVKGNLQEINVNENNHLIDTNIITNGSTVSHDAIISKSLPIITSVTSNQASNGSSTQSCTKGVGNSSQVRHVNRRKRFLFTNYIPKGKILVKVKSKDSANNVQDSSASSPPSSSKSLETNSQETSVNDTKCAVRDTQNVEHNVGGSDNNLTTTVTIPQVPTTEHCSPNFSKSVGNERRDSESPQVVIANVFSYATGKIYPTYQHGQKDLVGSVGTCENGKSAADCASSIDKQSVSLGLTHSCSDPPSLQSLQESMEQDGEEQLSLGEHRTLIAQQLKCGNCNGDFNSRAHLDAHLQRYTGENPFKCCYCQETFPDNGNLLVHLRTHMTLKPYKCSHCDKAFRHNSSLSVHLKLHTGEKSYKCPSCVKTFRQKIHLRNHLRVHTAELQFKCSDCEASFRSNSELVVHLLSHSGIRPYKCRCCDRLFSQECHLRSHEQAHCKQKADKCPYCNKVFKFGSSLTLHLRTHTGERPFKCTQCDLTFRQKQHLIVHVRRHTGEKPFVCQHCGKAFRHDTGLRSHLLIHPESDYSKAQAEMYTSEQLMKKTD